MKTRSFAAAAIAVLLLHSVGSARVVNRVSPPNDQTMRLVSMLPASDIVAVFDPSQFFDDALPKLLIGNQPALSEVIATINDIQASTGIDFSKFEKVAVGISSKRVSATETDYEPVVVASGDIRGAALFAVAKLAGDKAYREEKIGDRAVYILSSKEKEKTAGSKVAAFVAKQFRSITKDVAVSELDANTLILGSLPRVRETIEARSGISTDLISLVSVEEKTVLAFAARNSGKMLKFPPLDAPEFGEIIDSIKFLSGSIQMVDEGLRFRLLAISKTNERQKALRDTVDELRFVGKVVYGRSNRADQQVYGRMLKSAKIESKGSKMWLDIVVPQADINTLIAGMK